MSDYLANLVARSLEVSDRVAPRIASSFEPATGLRTLDSPFQEAAPPIESIEQDLFVEHSASGLATPTTSSPPFTSSLGESPLGAPLFRHHRPAAPSVDRARERASGSRSSDAEPRRGRAPHADPLRPSSSPPRPDAEPPKVSTSVAPRPAESRRVESTPSSRTPTHVPAPSSNNHPAGPADRRLGSPHRTNKARALDVAVVLSPNHTIGDVGAPRDPAITVALSGSPDAMALSASDAAPSLRSAASRSELMDLTGVEAAQPHSVERSPQAAAAPLTGSPSPASRARSAVAVQVRLRPEVMSGGPGNTARESAAGVSGSTVPATVHVTIGRLEVKATPAASPSRLRPSTPATASLDDYLRRRADGGGR